MDLVGPFCSFHLPEHHVWINKEHVFPNEHRQKGTLALSQGLRGLPRTFRGTEGQAALTGTVERL